MQFIIDKRVDIFVSTLSELDKGRILRYQDLFIRYQFTLASKYLKKISANLWELRPGNIRLLFGKISAETYVIVHGFKKKTQKIPAREFHTAIARLKKKTA